MATADQPKIFRKIEVIEGGGHHGGGWKVAYADFMTAMMAFFLLMWILASSDEQKLRGIAEYFTTATMPGGSGVLDGATLGPPGTLTASNGSVVARGSELGKNDDAPAAQWEVRDITETSKSKELASARETADDKKDESESGQATDIPLQTTDGNDIGTAHSVDDAKFMQLKVELLQAMQDNPDLAPLQKNVIFEQTPEGLHIQIIDQEGKPMFRSGRSEMNDATVSLLASLGESLSALPNRITLAGHTDSVPFAKGARYDNWDLSTDRANVTRRVFEASGVDNSRIIRVSGMADTQPLIPDDTTNASNRRISIKVQYRTNTALVSNSKPIEKSAVQAGASEQSPEMNMAPENNPGVMDNRSATEQIMIRSTQNRDPLRDEVFQNLRNALR